MIRAIAVALIALPLFAQVRETIDVSITSIDVVVTDGKGNRVRGLTRADFEVFENGKVREITNFTEYGGNARVVWASGLPSGGGDEGRPEAYTTPGTPPPPPRRIMLVFDGKTLTPTIRRGAAAAAIDFVDQYIRPNDQAMVAVLSQQFTPRTEWTSDRAALKAAIEAIGNESTPGTVQEERKRAEDRIEALIELAASTGGSPLAPKFEDLMQTARNFAEYTVQDMRATTALLGHIVAQLGRYPERKALILVGEGLDARPGWDLFQYLETLASRQVPTPGIEYLLRTKKPSQTPLIEAGKYSTSAMFAKLADTSYRAGVPIYALNPGVNKDAAEAMERHGSPPDWKQDFASFASKFLGYDLVATYSGGAAFVGRRADLALGQVAADLGGYYSIGFRATAPPRDAGAIRVRTKGNHHVRVSLATSIAPEPSDAVNDAVLAHHVLEPQSNDLEILLEPGEVEPAGDKRKVKLGVVIPIRNLQLETRGSELTGGFDVYLSISDGKSYFSPVNKQSHDLRLPAASAAGDDDRTITYTIDVLLEPGANLISVGVVDRGSKRTGYERVDVAAQ